MRMDERYCPPEMRRRISLNVCLFILVIHALIFYCDSSLADTAITCHPAVRNKVEQSHCDTRRLVRKFVKHTQSINANYYTPRVRLFQTPKDFCPHSSLSYDCCRSSLLLFCPLWSVYLLFNLIKEPYCFRLRPPCRLSDGDLLMGLHILHPTFELRFRLHILHPSFELRSRRTEEAGSLFGSRKSSGNAKLPVGE